MTNNFYHVLGDGLIPPLGYEDDPILTSGDDVLNPPHSTDNGDDIAWAGDGNDRIRLLNGDDEAHGQNGRDFLSGGNQNDRLFGDAGKDFLGGGNHNDVLDGGRSKDVLSGGWGDDVLNGSFGIDILVGGPGHDTLTGGTERPGQMDIFVLGSRPAVGLNFGTDTITDFVVGVDKLNLVHFTQHDPDNLSKLSITEDGADVELRYKGHLIAVLENTAGDGLSASDFII